MSGIQNVSRVLGFSGLLLGTLMSGPAAALPNPLVTYDSESALVQVLGFHPLYAPARSGFVPARMTVIGGTVGEYAFTRGAAELTLRTTRDAGISWELSGYHGYRWEEEELDGVQLALSATDGRAEVAVWRVGDFAFSCALEHGTREELRALLPHLVHDSRHYF